MEMPHVLMPHPATPCDAVSSINVAVARGEPGTLALRYTMSGRIAGIRIPPRAPAVRTDELWRHTCLEAFLRRAGEQGYAEFNFSPSSAWAAYRFTGYRAGMAPLAIAAPRFDVHTSENALTLHAILDASALGHLAGARLALTAVIEETNGRISYWSLAHPEGKPDFHHSDGFVLDLKEALRS
jgi:hypothetical protein